MTLSAAIPNVQPALLESGDGLGSQGAGLQERPDPVSDVPGVEGGVSKIVPVIRDGNKVVADSFAIALYLEEAYPDRPPLFMGEGGKTMARFIERWSQMIIHPYLGAAALMDIFHRQDVENQAYFRQSREARYGRKLEEVTADREADLAAFRASLEPLRNVLTYQPFIGGEGPLFPDYIVFGAFPMGSGDLAVQVSQSR